MPEAAFSARVYELVRRIPRGQVMTYGQVALTLGAPSAARAVGYAMAALSPATDVPWWRVINHRGGISLKGRGAEADLQRQMLEREGVVFGPDDNTDLATYRWWPDGEAEGPV